MTDKNTIIQIFGSLMKTPKLLSQVDKYSITPSDFETRFEKFIFVAIDNLYRNGAERINPVDVSNFLETNASGKVIFEQNNGIEYLQDCEFLSDENNFQYYYTKLKKFNLLRDLQKMGIDISEFYVEDLTRPHAFDVNKKFEELTIKDVVDATKKKLLKIEKDYIQDSNVQSWDLADEIDDVIDEFGAEENIGLPINGNILSPILNGAELGALTIRSGSSGLGKALPNRTKIPTPIGWRTVEEIKVGDYLFDAFGKPTKVLGIFPQGYKEVYQLTFKDGRTAKCSKDHLWSFVSCRQKKEAKEKRKFITLTAEEISKKTLQGKSGEFLVLIPMQKAVEYPEKRHYIPPYLFGLALGDGSFRQNPSNKSFQFSSENETLPSIIGNTMGWKVKKNRGENYTWYFEGQEVISFFGKKKKNIWVEDFLKEYPELVNADSHSKFIPRDYLEDSIENRVALLQGLMDTDGSVDKKGRTAFYTVSEQLRDNVEELARSLGYKTTVIVDTHKEKTTTFIISIQGEPQQKAKLFRLPRKVKRIIDWVNNGKRKEKNQFVPLVKIESLGYEDEMTCFLVDNKEHLFLTENFIPTHNTRVAVADCAKLAFPFYFDLESQKWVKSGSSESTLFIMTEQKPDQIIKMFLAYLSGINETKFRFNDLTNEEKKRIEIAKKIIKNFNNVKLMRIPDPSIEQLKLAVREEVIMSQRKYVFFDYIFVSPALLEEFRGHGLRNDECLLLMATALKDLAIEQNVSIFTSTQVNARADDNTEIRNESSLAGGRSTINKADNGMIMARPTKDEIDILTKDGTLSGGIIPNVVIDIFKVRSGNWNQVRVWRYFDLGTLRVKDLFVTDSRLMPIQNLNLYNYDWEITKEEEKYLKEINKKG